MPDLANRSIYEQRIMRSLAPIFVDQYRRAMRDPHHVPWDQFEVELRHSMRHELAGIFLTSALAMSREMDLKRAPGAIYGQSQAWADETAQELTDKIVAKSRELVEQAVKEADDRNALAAMLVLILASDLRLSTIATTEVTRAVSAAENFTAGLHNAELPEEEDLSDAIHNRLESQEAKETEAAAEAGETEEEGLEGNVPIASGGVTGHGPDVLPPVSTYRTKKKNGRTLVAIWVCEKDSRTCPICLGLDGHSEIVWRETYPGGPPGHVNCRCYTIWLALADLATP